ncbi:MAG: DUF2807 domain-containing protein [Anaerolineaceae bacterium]|nr:DUF2807 domain-containing protein [Anaerolineaceae bacterium]
MDTKHNRSSMVVGAMLLAIGILTLVGQFIRPFSGGILWPVIVIGFGLAFFVGMFFGGRSFGPLAIPGSIITGIGLILFIQNFFGLWETWSYAWALIICSVGIGLFIYGSWSELPDLRRSGLKVAQVGLILFVVFGIMFEVMFSISGVYLPVNAIFWPLMLVVLGLGMLIIRSYRLVSTREGYPHGDVNLFWPVIFIGAGILWILVRQDIVSPSQLNSLISLWPVLIVAAGINILLGRRLQWVNLLFGALVVAGMFYVVFYGQQMGLTSRSPWGLAGININSDQPVTQWVAGSGKTVDENREIGDISEVILRGSGDLQIIQGSTPSLTITAEDNLLQYILTETSGKRLIISTKRGIGFTNSRPVHYKLTVKDIRQISVSGAATIDSANLEVSSLGVDISGYGQANLANIQATTLDLNISGSGNMDVSGAVDRLDISISGAGGFNGPDLEAEDVSVEISGVGRAVVWATKTLKPSVSGVGSVSYYGDPTLNQNNSGLVNVRRIGSK